MPEPNDLPALDADVVSLLRAAKAVPALDAASKASLLAQVEARIAFPGGGGDGGGGGGSSGSPGATADPAPLASGATPVARAAFAARGAVGLALAIGVAGGVALDRTVLAPRAPVAAPVAVRPAPPPPAPAPLPAEPEVSALPVSALPTASAPAWPPASPRLDSPRAEVPAVSARGLGAERALLDVARAALARGDAQEVLAAVDHHEKEYRQGALVEEREALAVRALVALGQREAASARASDFERRFPNSLMLRAVKAAVGEAP